MLRRIVATVLLFTPMGCTTVRPVTLTPQMYLATHHPGRVWITHRDGSHLVLSAPLFLEADTLTGKDGERFREVLLGDVAQLHARQGSPARTLAALVAGFGAVVGLIYGFTVLTKVSDHPTL